MSSPRLHSRQAVACLILTGDARVLFISRSAPRPKRRAAHQDLSNCSDEVQSSLAIPSNLLSYKILNSSLCFPVSKLGSDWSVCITHMHLRVIYYEYGIANQP